MRVVLEELRKGIKVRIKEDEIMAEDADMSGDNNSKGVRRSGYEEKVVYFHQFLSLQ